MNEAKALIVPATFAYVGMRATSALGVNGTLMQIAVGIAGAGLGLFLAKKI